MFAEKFLALTSKYPQNADALTRIALYFEDIEKRYGSGFTRIKLDPQRLFEISGAGSVSRLSSVIAQLISERLIERRIVVKSFGGSGVEYRSMAEVPNIQRDPDRDIDIEVTPDNISTIYLPIDK